MMGRNHAITGAGSWIAIVSTSPVAFGVLPLEPGQVLLGAIVCAGAALLPDADHPSATIARSIPVIGRAGANAVSGLAGGHRHGTHSLLSIPAIVLLAWALRFAVVDVGWRAAPLPIGLLLAVTALGAFAVKSLGAARGWLAAWGIGAAIAAVTLLDPRSADWVPHAIVIGFVVHLVGDLLTIGGLPLLWPWNPRPPKTWRQGPGRFIWMSNGYFALPLLGKTGSLLEQVLGAGVGVYTAFALVALVAGWIGPRLP